MAASVQTGEASNGPRWELLDQLVKSYARVVEDPDQQLSVPLRR
jgi:hypothetical protein